MTPSKSYLTIANFLFVRISDIIGILKLEIKIMKLILFDIDGTLIGGKHGHPKSYSDAIKAIHGIDIEIDWKGVQGMTDQQILTKYLVVNNIPENIISKNMVSYMKEMEKSFNASIGNSTIHPLDGVEKLLIELKSKGALLGLVTGNIVSIARAKLEKLNLWGYFNVGGFGSDDISRARLVKLAIQRAEKKFNFVFDKNVILFGDAPQDMKAGIDADIYTIGVTTGVYSKEDLNKVGAKVVVDSLKNTKEIVKLIDSILL